MIRMLYGFITTSSTPITKERAFSSETLAKLDKTPCRFRNPNVYFRTHKTVSVACTEIQISLGPYSEYGLLSVALCIILLSMFIPPRQSLSCLRGKMSYIFLISLLHDCRCIRFPGIPLQRLFWVQILSAASICSN